MVAATTAVLTGHRQENIMFAKPVQKGLQSRASCPYAPSPAGACTSPPGVCPRPCPLPPSLSIGAPQSQAEHAACRGRWRGSRGWLRRIGRQHQADRLRPLLPLPERPARGARYGASAHEGAERSVDGAERSAGRGKATPRNAECCRVSSCTLPVFSQRLLTPSPPSPQSISRLRVQRLRC